MFEARAGTDIRAVGNIVRLLSKYKRLIAKRINTPGQDRTGDLQRVRLTS